MPEEIVELPVGKTTNDNALPADVSIARKQVARAAKPTRADAPEAEDPPTIYESEDVSDDQRPENLARAQSQHYADKMKEAKDALQASEEEINRLHEADADAKQRMRTGEDRPKVMVSAQKALEIENQIKKEVNQYFTPEHRFLPAKQDGAVIGSRSGNPLENAAEDLLGDKVHDILPDGSIVLKVQTADKTRAVAVLGENLADPEILKVKVNLRFPAINPHVAQREIGIQVDKNDPAVMYLPPDNAAIDVLLPIECLVHLELVHIDQDGKRGHPYVLDFNTSKKSPLRPFVPAVVGYSILEEVRTKIPADMVDRHKPVMMGVPPNPVEDDAFKKHTEAMDHAFNLEQEYKQSQEKKAKGEAKGDQESKEEAERFKKSDPVTGPGQQALARAEKESKK